MSLRQWSGSFPWEPTFHSPSRSTISKGIRSSLSPGEKSLSLFQPDVLLPAQYFAINKKEFSLEPEIKLILAILTDAIECFQKYASASSAGGKALFREAEAWIFEKNSDWFFSFENVCEVLGFNPEYLRHGLILWRQKETANRTRAKRDPVTLRKRLRTSGIISASR